MTEYIERAKVKVQISLTSSESKKLLAGTVVEMGNSTHALKKSLIVVYLASARYFVLKRVVDKFLRVMLRG